MALMLFFPSFSLFWNEFTQACCFHLDGHVRSRCASVVSCLVFVVCSERKFCLKQRGAEALTRIPSAAPVAVAQARVKRIYGSARFRLTNLVIGEQTAEEW